MESILTMNPLKADDSLFVFTKEKCTSVWQPNEKRSHSAQVAQESDFKDPNDALCGFHLLTAAFCWQEGIPAVRGLLLCYTGCRSKAWQVDTIISFEQQMPACDIAWISHLNSESKWACLKFCASRCTHKVQIKARRKKNLFFWAQDTCAAKSKVGGRENNLNQPAQMGDALLFPAEAGSWQSPSLVQQAHCWRSWWSHSRGNVHSYLEERLESSAYQHVLKWSCFQVRNVKQWSYMRRERCSVSPGDGSQRAVL